MSGSIKSVSAVGYALKIETRPKNKSPKTHSIQLERYGLGWLLKTINVNDRLSLDELVQICTAIYDGEVIHKEDCILFNYPGSESPASVRYDSMIEDLINTIYIPITTS